MTYFAKFPRVLYSVNKEGNDAKIVPDILARVQVIESIISNQNLYFKYEIKGGETPEQIADRVYGDSQKHWIILLVNQIIDPQFGWALGPFDFEKHIKQKYASLNVSLSTSESYPAGYTVGEVVYQGSAYEKSTAEGTVVAYNSGTKTLQVKFASQILANGSNITGVTSAQTHSIIGITNNLDGYQWAVNTVSHYEATEVRINSDEPRNPETRKYRVSANAYDYSTNTVISINTNTSYSNTYNVVSSVDGSNAQLTVVTTIAPVSFYEHEVQLNENRRRIVVPKSSVISAIETQFASLMSMQ